MLPGLLLNRNRFPDYVTDVVEAAGGTFLFKGHWFSNSDTVVSTDPANVHYILNKNFHNYPKGPEFKKIFEAFGDGIFRSEGKNWENQRKTLRPLINHPDFQKQYVMISWEKIETILIPILNLVAKTGKIVDLQELLMRLTYDCTCIQVLGHDPCSLKQDMPCLPHQRAFVDLEEAIALRHIFPEASWKLQEWLQIGKEHKLSNAKKAIGEFLSSCISLKYKSWNTDDIDLLSGFMRTFPGSSDMTPDSWKYMMLNFVSAGKDTISSGVSWLFWLIATHPEKQEKLRQEIKENLSVTEGCTWTFSNIDELQKLSYLHGAVCEALRLFPPVAFQHKAPTTADTLPSGHKIKSNTKILLSYYSMGRTKSIWGADCLDFKPERWISETGRIVHVSASKFPVFNGGPRSCLGKETTLTQIKIIAAAIINRFKIEAIEVLPVEPTVSMIIFIKHGLKVKVSNCLD